MVADVRGDGYTMMEAMSVWDERGEEDEVLRELVRRRPKETLHRQRQFQARTKHCLSSSRAS